jgi:hypothetical protein
MGPIVPTVPVVRTTPRGRDAPAGPRWVPGAVAPGVVPQAGTVMGLALA